MERVAVCVPLGVVHHCTSLLQHNTDARAGRLLVCLPVRSSACPCARPHATLGLRARYANTRSSTWFAVRPCSFVCSAAHGVCVCGSERVRRHLQVHAGVQDGGRRGDGDRAEAQILRHAAHVCGAVCAQDGLSVCRQRVRQPCAVSVPGHRRPRRRRRELLQYVLSAFAPISFLAHSSCVPVATRCSAADTVEQHGRVAARLGGVVPLRDSSSEPSMASWSCSTSHPQQPLSPPSRRTHA